MITITSQIRLLKGMANKTAFVQGNVPPLTISILGHGGQHLVFHWSIMFPISMAQFLLSKYPIK